MLQQVPEWFGTAVVGALIAALGYVGNLSYQAWKAVREEKHHRRSRLVELQSLLRAASTSYKTQNMHANAS